MKKSSNPKVNEYRARMIAGEIDVAAQNAQLAMFAPQPSADKYAMELAQWNKKRNRANARLENTIEDNGESYRKAVRAFNKMETEYGKWYENQMRRDPSFTIDIGDYDARVEMASAAWQLKIELIENNGDELELARLSIALESDWNDARVYHAVNSLGNVIKGNIKFYGKLNDTLVDSETFQWSDHKQYVKRIVAFMRSQTPTQFIIDRLAEYNVVDKAVRDVRDRAADVEADRIALNQAVAPSHKAINDDVLRTLALSY